MSNRTAENVKAIRQNRDNVRVAPPEFKRNALLVALRFLGLRTEDIGTDVINRMAAQSDPLGKISASLIRREISRIPHSSRKKTRIG